jgi:Pyruvate/2-oxoacid:ferredoxin oxidoreductase gamma subunit
MASVNAAIQQAFSAKIAEANIAAATAAHETITATRAAA